MNVDDQVLTNNITGIGTKITLENVKHICY